jgi:hypothetical protein
MAADTSVRTLPSTQSTQTYTTVSFNMSFVSNGEASRGLAEKRGKFNFTIVTCRNVPLASAIKFFKRSYENIDPSSNPKILKVKAEQLNLRNSEELIQIRTSIDGDSIKKNLDMISHFFDSAFPFYAPRISDIIITTFDPLTMPDCDYESSSLEMDPEDKQVYEGHRDAYEKKLSLEEALKQISPSSDTKEHLTQLKQNSHEDSSDDSLSGEDLSITPEDILKMKTLKHSSPIPKETHTTSTTQDTSSDHVDLDDELLRSSDRLGLNFSEDEGSSDTESSYTSDSSATTPSTLSSFGSES